MPAEKACKKFGTRIVKVKVISVGDNTHEAAKQADQAVKADVAKDINRNIVGNAATQEDWIKAKKQGAGQPNGTVNSTTVSNILPPPGKTISSPRLGIVHRHKRSRSKHSNYKGM